MISSVRNIVYRSNKFLKAKMQQQQKAWEHSRYRLWYTIDSARGVLTSCIFAGGRSIHRYTQPSILNFNLPKSLFKKKTQKYFALLIVFMQYFQILLFFIFVLIQHRCHFENLELNLFPCTRAPQNKNVTAIDRH